MKIFNPESYLRTPHLLIRSNKRARSHSERRISKVSRPGIPRGAQTKLYISSIPMIDAKIIKISNDSTFRDRNTIPQRHHCGLFLFTRYAQSHEDFKGPDEASDTTL